MRGAADGKGDMIVGALQTDNSASSDSNDFNFSFNPDSIMGGGIGGTTIGGGQSDYEGSGNDYAGSTINAGGTVSGVADNMYVADSQITGDKVDIDLGGDLIIETTPDTWQGSGSSWNANVGTGGFGGGKGNIEENKNWTETPAGIFGKTEVDLDVDGTTHLVGGAIVSETEGGLSLVTGDLEVVDVAINDYAQDTYTGGQVNVNIGGIIEGDIDHSNDTTKDDLFNENKYGTVEHSDVGHDKEGIIKGTISGGSVTIGGTRDGEGNVQGGETLDVAALEDMGVNTDADNIVTITKDESWEESFKIDLVNVGVVAEQVDNLVNVVESFTAKVPDHVKAQGEAAEDYFRKSIANGYTQEEALAYSQSQEFQDVVEIRKYLEKSKDKNGNYNPKEVYVALQLEMAGLKDYYDTNCASAPSNIGACADLAKALSHAAGMNISTDDLTVDAINGMIAGYKDLLASTTDKNLQGKYKELMSLAEDCKRNWLTDSSNLLELHEDKNVDLGKELGSIGYNEDLANRYTVPMLDILSKMEKGEISEEDAYGLLKDLESQLKQERHDIESIRTGSGIDTKFADASYREALGRLESGLSNVSNNIGYNIDFKDKGKGLTTEQILSTASGMGSSLLIQEEFGYSSSPREMGEVAVAAAEWAPIVGDVMDGGRCIAGDKGSCAMILVPSMIEKGAVLVRVGGKYVAKRLDDGAELTAEQVGDIVGDSKVFAYNSDATIMGRIEYDYVDGQKIEKFIPDDNYYDNISTAGIDDNGILQVAEPRDLNEQVLWNRVIEDPSAGKPLDLGDDPRFGASKGFQKMEVKHKLPNGKNITIHYQYNYNSGKAYDMKITTPQR